MVIAPLLCALLMQSSAAADRPRGYAFGSVVFAHHPPNDVHYRDIAFPVGGDGWDVGGGGGVFVFQRVVGIEGEFVYGGTVSTPQYTFYDEQARDVLLNALVRYQPGGGRLALVAGGGLASTRRWQDPAQPNRLPELRHGTTVTFGADVTAAGARHVAVAGSFRVRWADRGDPFYGYGFGALTYQLGTTVSLR